MSDVVESMSIAAGLGSTTSAGKLSTRRENLSGADITNAKIEEAATGSTEAEERPAERSGRMVRQSKTRRSRRAEGLEPTGGGIGETKEGHNGILANDGGRQS